MTTTTEQDEDLAFEQGFNDTAPEPTAAPTPFQADAEPPATDTPAIAATPAVAKPVEKPPEPVEDPFASLPPAVRDLLARVPALEARLEQTTRVANMVPALQSRLDKLNQQPAATTDPVPAKSRFAKVEALRNELPEIADALDEIVNDRHPAPVAQKPEPRQPVQQAADDNPQEDALTSVRPSWADDLVSSDFQLWLARQPRDYQAQVQNTSKAGEILKALGQFDVFKEQTTSTQQLSQRRTTRMAAAVTPQGDGRRGRQAAVDDDEDAAMAAAFNKARGGR